MSTSSASQTCGGQYRKTIYKILFRRPSYCLLFLSLISRAPNFFGPLFLFPRRCKSMSRKKGVAKVQCLEIIHFFTTLKLKNNFASKLFFVPHIQYPKMVHWSVGNEPSRRAACGRRHSGTRGLGVVGDRVYFTLNLTKLILTRPSLSGINRLRDTVVSSSPIIYV